MTILSPRSMTTPTHTAYSSQQVRPFIQDMTILSPQSISTPTHTAYSSQQVRPFIQDMTILSPQSMSTQKHTACSSQQVRPFIHDMTILSPRSMTTPTHTALANRSDPSFKTWQSSLLRVWAHLTHTACSSQQVRPFIQDMTTEYEHTDTHSLL